MPKMGKAPAKQVQTILGNLKEVSDRFAQERRERQRRRELVKADFDQLKEAGFLLTGVPVDQGGIWEDGSHSTRPICEMLRTLAHGDSSVALVAAMHPAVIISASTWAAVKEAPPPFRQAWEEQRQWVFQTVLDGHWWGTIMSEPGSGGDIMKTKAVAKPGPLEGKYFISGQKHFGSGSGITSFMITAAVAEGEVEPDVFFMDMRGVPWDGSAGVKLSAAWDGYGMTATQSHAMAFEGYPATRLAWPRPYAERTRDGGGGGPLFASVIVGVVETAVETARRQLEGKRDSMRAYEQTEWSRVELESWLIQQAYEGMLRAVEEGRNARRSGVLGKTAVAELAESVILRICKIIGGGSYSRQSPFGAWLEDVRALGFLRPPWGPAYDQIFQGSWDAATGRGGTG